MSALETLLFCCGLLSISTLSPGPDVLLVFRTALSQGFKAGFLVSSGISLGFFFHTCVICFAGAWLMSQPWSFLLVMAGGLYLLLLAWQIFSKLNKPAEIDLKAGSQSHRGLFWKGLLCNLPNVKCVLFITSLILPGLEQFHELSWYRTSMMIALPLVGWMTWMLWCWCLQLAPLRRFYLNNLRLWDALFALLLSFFACRVLWLGWAMS